MKIGTLALAVIFFAGGAKNIKDSRMPHAGIAEMKAAARRKLFYGVVMLLLGLLVTVHYLISF